MQIVSPFWIKQLSRENINLLFHYTFAFHECFTCMSLYLRHYDYNWEFEKKKNVIFIL